VSTTVAIHQPTFLPWLGWWDKFTRADVFVLLDDVQFPKKGGTWMNRVRVLVEGDPAWITVPLDRTHHGVRSVRDTLVDDATAWRERLIRTISTSYARAPYFKDAFPVVRDVLETPGKRIAELNETAIRRFAAELGFDTSKLVRQSELGLTGSGTDLLVEICIAVGATAYLTGDGAGNYLEPEKFDAAQMELIQQRFDAPVYTQLSNTFVPGLSCVDALMNCGHADTALLLRPAN
jgi:hypothetical protein